MFTKDSKENVITEKTAEDYGFYSKMLNKPFNDLKELREAEAKAREAEDAKKAKAEVKKQDASGVELAFKQVNTAETEFTKAKIEARKVYTAALIAAKKAYTDALTDAETKVTAARKNYNTMLQEFNKKYPEGFHITLKDGDTTTTIAKQIGGANPFTAWDDVFNFMINHF